MRLISFCPSFQTPVQDSCYGVVNEPVSYFRNPSWPASDTDPNYCTYSIKV